MTTVTLQKELKKVVQKHTAIGDELKRILTLVEQREDDLVYGDWELKPSAIRRVERARKEIAAGKGITLKTEEEIHKFFQDMRHGKQFPK